MKKLILSALLIAGLISVNPGVASACGKCGGGKGKNVCKTVKIKNKMKMLWLHKDYLELTDEQISQLKDIKHSAIKDIIRLMADVKIVKVDLKAAMWQETINLDKVNSLVDAKYAAKTKIAKVYVKALADIKQVLTEEQRKKALDLAIKAKIKGSCPVTGCSMCPGASGGKTCPLTGKPLGMKGSGAGGKGSMRGSM